MVRPRHQLAPAVPVQQVINCAVAGRVADRLLIGRLEIADVQQLAGTRPLGKARQQGLFLRQRHILVLAPAVRLGLERLDAAVVVGHVRAVHRAQRHAHALRDRRLHHPAFAQEHHLDALALSRRQLPAQRRFQPPHLGLAAFDHLLPPNQMAEANHAGRNEDTASTARLARNPHKNLDSIRHGGGISARAIRTWEISAMPSF